jgi:hypothetical protein
LQANLWIDSKTIFVARVSDYNQTKSDGMTAPRTAGGENQYRVTSCGLLGIDNDLTEN